MNKAIHLQDVQKKMNDFEIGPLNFTNEDGFITAVVGRNGSGKSTLLKMLMRLVKPTAGKIELFGENIAGNNENWKKRVAYQAQTSIGYDPFTGKQLQKLIRGYYPNWDDAYFLDIIRRLNVSLDKRFMKMSQGDQQKIVLALTFARNTDLLLLDEPTSFLDIPAKNELMKMITEWMDVGNRSIMMTSHQAEDINKLADFVLVMREGKLSETYEKDTLIESYAQYWLASAEVDQLPGEIVRESNLIYSNDPEVTEAALREHTSNFERQNLDLEKVIALLLEEEG